MTVCTFSQGKGESDGTVISKRPHSPGTGHTATPPKRCRDDEVSHMLVLIDIYSIRNLKFARNLKFTTLVNSMKKMMLCLKLGIFQFKKPSFTIQSTNLTLIHYGSCTVIIRRDFLVFNLRATFLFGFLLHFTSGLLWQKSGHPILLEAQESKLCSGESKMSNIFTIAGARAEFHLDLFYI